MADEQPILQLAEFLSLFARAGSQAAQEAARESKRHLLEFFDEKDGEHTAKTVTVKAGGQDVKVPLLSIAQPASVRFGDMKLKFAAAVDITKVGAAVHNHEGLMKKAIEVEVELSFESQEPPEGFELIRDRFNRDLDQALGRVSISALNITPAEAKEEIE